MPNKELNRKLNNLTPRERVEAVKLRSERGHYRATSGRGWHVVKQTAIGVAECTCKDFKYQKGEAQEKCCKHMWSMYEQGLIGLTYQQVARWHEKEMKR